MPVLVNSSRQKIPRVRRTLRNFSTLRTLTPAASVGRLAPRLASYFARQGPSGFPEIRRPHCSIVEKLNGSLGDTMEEVSDEQYEGSSKAR